MQDKTWPAVTDALADIKTQLSQDAAFLEKKVHGDPAGDGELTDRVHHVLQLAVLMEETIDKVLAGLDEKKETQPAFEVHHLEYTSHTIGTPDEGAAKDIEDLTFDKEEKKTPADTAPKTGEEAEGAAPKAEEGAAEPEAAEEKTAVEDNAQPEETPTEEEEQAEEELRALAAEEEEIAKEKDKKEKAKKDKEKKRKDKKEKKEKKEKKSKKDKDKKSKK